MTADSNHFRRSTEARRVVAGLRVMPLLAAVATVTAICATAICATATAGLREKLEKGDVVITQRDIKGSDLPESTMKGLVNAPPAAVWAFLSECNKYKRYMPRTKSAKQLSKKGNVVVCKVVVDMPWPMDDLWSETKAIHTVKPKLFRRAWTLIRGTYTKNSGSWTIVPYGDDGKRSLVTYKMHAEPTTAVPKWMQRKAAKSTLPDLMHAVRKASGATPNK